MFTGIVTAIGTIVEAQNKGPSLKRLAIASPFEAAGIELIRPDEADRAFIHEVYFSELVKGVGSATRRVLASSTSLSG